MKHFSRSLFRPCPSLARQAFTLIELLVVIAVIAILVALLLPAVQQAREAARKTQCRNNLKQIGLATHNYHDVHRSLPSGGEGGLASPVPTARPASKKVGWGVALLPFMDQKNIYDAWNMHEWHSHPDNVQLAQSRLPVYLCPSNPQADQNKPEGKHREVATATDIFYGRNDYGGNFGDRGLRCDPSPVGTFSCRNDYDDGSTPSQRGPMSLGNTRTLRFRDITDGLSHTIWIGEAPQAEWGIWAGIKNLHDQSVILNSRIGDIDPRIGRVNDACAEKTSETLRNRYPKGIAACDVNAQEFHSAHHGGVFFSFLDGSVRFLSEQADVKLYAALLSYRGGEITGEF